MLMRKRELPPASMVLGLKDLLAVIPVPASYTSTSAEAGTTLVTPGWSALSAPAGIVFVYVADEAPAGAVTWTVIVQVPGGVGGVALGGIVPPVKVTVRGSVVETVPPQVVAAEPLTTVRTVPGRVSEIFTPV